MSLSYTLSASTGVAFALKKSETLKVINTHGGQVVSLWALLATNPQIHLSTSHTHAIHRHLTPSPPSLLFSNTSTPLLTFTTDTTPGHHDTLISACNATRYAALGHQGWHASCEENFRLAVEKFGLMGAPGIAPSPVNLFMNVKVRGVGGLGFERPSVGKGEEVGFRAEADLVVVLSACPMDFRASEEWVPEPVGVEYHILEGE